MGVKNFFFGSSIITRKFAEILMSFYWKLFGIKKFLYFDDAHHDMENSFLALAPKCSGNIDEDHLIFKYYYIYDILAPKFDPQGGGGILTPLGTPSIGFTYSFRSGVRY